MGPRVCRFFMDKDGWRTAKYVDAFFQNIRWESVLARVERARQIPQG